MVEEKQVSSIYWIWQMAPLGNIKCMTNNVCSSCTAWASSPMTKTVTWHLAKTMIAGRENTREKG